MFIHIYIYTHYTYHTSLSYIVSYYAAHSSGQRLDINCVTYIIVFAGLKAHRSGTIQSPEVMSHSSHQRRSSPKTTLNLGESV